MWLESVSLGHRKIGPLFLLVTTSVFPSTSPLDSHQSKAALEVLLSTLTPPAHDKHNVRELLWKQAFTPHDWTLLCVCNSHLKLLLFSIHSITFTVMFGLACFYITNFKAISSDACPYLWKPNTPRLHDWIKWCDNQRCFKAVFTAKTEETHLHLDPPFLEHNCPTNAFCTMFYVIL